MGKTRKKRKKRNKKHTYKRRDYISNDGMLTSVWGPPLWHVLHCISFNYPNKPTKSDKKNYKRFIVLELLGLL